MIRIKDLTKMYGSDRALDSISIKLDKGKVIGLVGPNGTGKTTLIKLISGLIRPTKGDIERDLDLHHISLASEVLGFPSYNKVKWIIEVFRKMKSASLDRVNHVVQLIGLEEHLHKGVNNLSQGLKQRLNIACAVIGNPELVILDEPNNGLDPDGFQMLRGLIRDLKAEGKTVIIASHILSEIQLTCDDVVIMFKGQIVTHESVENLVRDHGSLDEAYAALTFDSHT